MTGAQGMATEPSRRQSPGYIRQMHVELVILLIVICAGAAITGWSLRPQSSGFPSVPENLSLTLTGQQVGTVHETLVRTPANGTMLELQGNDIDQSVAPTSTWSLSVGNLGPGRVCTPSVYVTSDGSAEVRLARYHLAHPPLVSVGGPPVVFTDVVSSGFIYVVLCWSSGGPVSLSGSYLSAQFPPVSHAGPNSSVIRTLIADAGDTGNFALESQAPPAGSSSGAWQWSSPLGVSAPTLRFSAINVSGTQHDTFRAFLSGIFFGIAGGAIITFLQELVVPFSRRRDALNTP
jgi:hypothetical protein